MAIQTRVEPIHRDIELMLSEALSPTAQSQAFADFAAEQIRDADQSNKSALGRVPRRTIAVDGREGAALETVKPDGIIIAEYEVVTDVLAWIGEQLVLHSPVGKTGRYQSSHTLMVDGDSYVFANTVPYARKIELGSSSQAPDGVYQSLATLAARRFGNLAKIEFGYRAILGGEPVNQKLAHSFGGWFFGHFHEARAASGVRESRLAKVHGKTAHNRFRFPAITVSLRG